MSDEFDPAAVPVRPAATVMLVRDASAPSGTAVEVFMLRRTAGASFGAGMYVFPGGRVDLGDHAADLAHYCRGLDDESASRQLGLEAGGLAYWVAAVRECFEEAGVLLAERRDGGPLQLRNEDRHAVHDGELALIDLCRRDDLVLDLSTTHYVAHWITPVGERRRFDTRFFLSEAPPEQEPLHDDKETVDSLWVRPADALRMQVAGELMMMPPTIANLQFLEPHDTAAEALAAGAAIGQPPCIQPRLRFGPDGKIVGIALPGDPDYGDD
jgi:8-oxo-dGTP pyrophosphatase MutT (NUDIX family)